MTVIALDAMGGDFAPRAPVEAAVRAVKSGTLRVILVGDQSLLEQELNRHRHSSGQIEIQHASEVVGMEESPAEALRRKKDASIRVAFEMIRQGRAEAVVGAGHSGALMIAGKLVLGAQPGITRPAIATRIPHRRGITILLDSGANVDCKPAYLEQFAGMGHVYARVVLELADPRVALLNNGNEPGKGNELTRAAHELLSKGKLTFLGNLEPRDLFRGRADVIVCDGFAGNLVLKTAEAAAQEVRFLMRESAYKTPWARLGNLLLRGFFLDLARRTDYREIGGSQLLGLRGVAVVCHGSSNARAIHNALQLAAESAEHGLVREIAGYFKKK